MGSLNAMDTAHARGRRRTVSPVREARSGSLPAAGWRGLYRAGGAAALLAGVLFRRNIAAEITLFSTVAIPAAVEDWFALLRTNRLLGLAYLNFFDVINYALLGLMFLALYAALKEQAQSTMAVAAVCGLAGIAVYFASNTTFSMLALSEQYASAAAGAQRAMLLSAGQALLAIDHTGVGYPGTGIYLSFLLIAAATLLCAAAMLRGGSFGRAAAFTGILAGAIDLAYCATFAIAPALTACLMSAAGLLLMIWHILVGLRLWRMGRKGNGVSRNNANTSDSYTEEIYQ